jgi:hypothetical protein
MWQPRYWSPRPLRVTSALSRHLPFLAAVCPRCTKLGAVSDTVQRRAYGCGASYVFVATEKISNVWDEESNLWWGWISFETPRATENVPRTSELYRTRAEAGRTRYQCGFMSRPHRPFLAAGSVLSNSEAIPVLRC